MAVSAADKPIYVPQIRPQVSDPTSELAHVADWSAREFDNVSRGLIGGVPRWNLQTINAPPSRPRTGDIEYADGVNWNPGYGEGLYVYKLGVWVPFGVGAGGRIRLNTATNFYFDTGTGIDTNPGTSALPWLTQAPLWARFDFGGQTVTLNQKNNSTATLDLRPWVGGGALICDGGAHSIAVVGGNAIQAVTAPLPGNVTLQNFSSLSTTTSGDCVLCSRNANFTIGASMSFGACAQSHIDALAGGTVRATTNYTITGSAGNHWFTDTYGNIVIFGRTITLTGTPAFSGAFANCSNGQMTVSADTFSGGATGVRYLSARNGIIDTAGGGAAYLPGNAAGSIASQGQYL